MKRFMVLAVRETEPDDTRVIFFWAANDEGIMAGAKLAMMTLMDFASDPDDPFTWQDADLAIGDNRLRELIDIGRVFV